MNKTHLPLVAGVSCVLLAVAFSAHSQTLTFSATNVPTGSGPAMVIPVDINGDGFPGLVCANFGFGYTAIFGAGNGSGDTLSVFTNDGFGNLSPSQTLTVGNSPVGLATADVNGDGKEDVICGNVGSNSLSVLTNNGLGGFAPAGTYPVGTGPVSVAAADVNGDGKVDLICANYGDDTLTVLTNDGNGFFTVSAVVPTGSQPYRVVAADFNGDGNMDLVCANSGDGTLSVFTNDGRGDFTLLATNTVSGGVEWVTVVEANGDDKPDLATASGGLISTISILTNNGAAIFTLASTVSSSGASMVAAGDINGDGKDDLVCNNNGSGIQGSMTVLTNDGRGNFTVSTTVPVGTTDWPYIGGNYPNFVTVADFNGDGNDDVAVSCFGTAVVTELVQENVNPKPPAQPVIGSVSVSGANLMVNAVNGQSGQTYYLLTSTNVALPLSQWAPVATNVLNANGNFEVTATNTVSPIIPQRFYILQTPPP